ncbi:hypothetical protein CPB85DRAFT_1445283 [Mucidula mucida]|nr:hypothetical protein CPB85DRAFT_1445283 [Mucidula mucida]
MSLTRALHSETPHIILSLICLIDMRWWSLGRSSSSSDGAEQSIQTPCASGPAVQCRPEQTNVPAVTTTFPTQRTSSSRTAQQTREATTHPNLAPYDELRSQLQRTTEELETVRRELMDERRTLSEALTQSQSEVATLRQQLQQEGALRSEDKKLLDTRSQELQDSQAYLTIADTVSIAETLAMVENLNSDIFQVAATVADEAFLEHYELSKENAERARRCFGDNILRLLYEARHRDNESRSLVIQTVVQFALTQACLDITLFWDATLASTSLGTAYNHIRTKSSQSVSARWRHVSLTFYPWSCRFLVGREELQPIGNTYLHAVGQRFLPGLQRVVKDIVTLDRAMGEGLMSTDAELVTISGGEIYDKSFMENGFTGDGDRDGGNSDGGGNAAKVVCTTDLGLQAGGRGGRGAGTQLLLKPKVVLWSALLDAPQADVGQF